MDNSANLHFIKIQHLLAENESLKARLEECELLATNRQTIIQKLTLQIAENAGVRSELDEQVTALAALQNFISDMVAEIPHKLQQATITKNNLHHQLEAYKKQCILVQATLADQQSQLQHLTNQNFYCNSRRFALLCWKAF